MRSYQAGDPNDTVSRDSGPGFVARAKTRIDRYAFGVTAAKGMAARYLDVVLIAAADPA